MASINNATSSDEDDASLADERESEEHQPARAALIPRASFINFIQEQHPYSLAYAPLVYDRAATSFCSLSEQRESGAYRVNQDALGEIDAKIASALHPWTEINFAHHILAKEQTHDLLNALLKSLSEFADTCIELQEELKLESTKRRCTNPPSNALRQSSLPAPGRNTSDSDDVVMIDAGLYHCNNPLPLPNSHSHQLSFFAEVADDHASMLKAGAGKMDPSSDTFWSYTAVGLELLNRSIFSRVPPELRSKLPKEAATGPIPTALERQFTSGFRNSNKHNTTLYYFSGQPNHNVLDCTQSSSFNDALLECLRLFRPRLNSPIPFPVMGNALCGTATSGGFYNTVKKVTRPFFEIPYFRDLLAVRTTAAERQPTNPKPPKWKTTMSVFTLHVMGQDLTLHLGDEVHQLFVMRLIYECSPFDWSLLCVSLTPSSPRKCPSLVVLPIRDLKPDQLRFSTKPPVTSFKDLLERFKAACTGPPPAHQPPAPRAPHNRSAAPTTYNKGGPPPSAPSPSSTLSPVPSSRAPAPAAPRGVFLADLPADEAEEGMEYALQLISHTPPCPAPEAPATCAALALTVTAPAASSPLPYLPPAVIHQAQQLGVSIPIDVLNSSAFLAGLSALVTTVTDQQAAERAEEERQQAEAMQLEHARALRHASLGSYLALLEAIPEHDTQLPSMHSDVSALLHDAIAAAQNALGLEQGVSTQP